MVSRNDLNPKFFCLVILQHMVLFSGWEKPVLKMSCFLAYHSRDKIPLPSLFLYNARALVLLCPLRL